MLWKVVQNGYLHIENYGSTRIMKLKLIRKYEILKILVTCLLLFRDE